MELLIPDWHAELANVGALSTLRPGGYSQGPYGSIDGDGLNLAMHVADSPAHVSRNRRLLRSILPTEPLWLTQVHGNKVVEAEALTLPVEADACVASTRGMVCAVMSADCLPVLLCDGVGEVVGVAHAGWRGLASGVLENTVTQMRRRGGGDIQAWLGPAIGAQQFEVGQEVLDAFVDVDAACRAAFIPSTESDGKFLADIYQLARRRLARVGVERVTGGGLCTVSDQRFYSYRRDQTTGRMVSLIWLR